MKNKFNSKTSANKKLFLYILAAFFILAPTIAMLVFQPKFAGNFIQDPAQPERAIEVYFEPRERDENGITTVSVMADSGDTPVAFARVVFNFDIGMANLIGEIITNPNLTTVVRKPQASVVNEDGRVEIVVAAAPGDSQPTGVFELATFQIQSVNPGIESTATLYFDSGDMQFVETGATEMAIESRDADINI